jgi:hypothetical protein
MTLKEHEAESGKLFGQIRMNEANPDYDNVRVAFSYKATYFNHNDPKSRTCTIEANSRIDAINQFEARKPNGMLVSLSEKYY